MSHFWPCNTNVFVWIKTFSGIRVWDKLFSWEMQALRSRVYLFVPAAASASLHGEAISGSWPLAGRERTFQLCRGEEVDFTERLCDLQSGEGVVSRRSRRFLLHHPGNKLFTVCYLRGSVGKRQRHLCCTNSGGPVCRVRQVHPAFLPDDSRVVDVKVPQVLLGQDGVLNRFVVLRFVSGWWISLMILWRCGRLCLGWEKLIGGVGVGGRKVIVRSTLD